MIIIRYALCSHKMLLFIIHRHSIIPTIYHNLFLRTLYPNYPAYILASINLSLFFSDPILLVSLAIIGRFGVTVAYNSGAQYATELIPTCVRGQGVAAVHVAGYALTFFSSYILYLVC